MIIVSGGKGAGESITEAEAMERYLAKHDIPRAQIIKEEKSTSTFENFKFSKKMMQNQNMKLDVPILVITNDFHAFRTKMIAKRFGLNITVIPAKTPWIAVPNLYVREYFAVIKSYFIDWVT